MSESSPRPLSDWQLTDEEQSDPVLRVLLTHDGRGVAAKRVALNAMLSTLTAEIARLRAALEEFGWHHHQCPEYFELSVKQPCTCGFDAALRREEGRC